jgi:hypothetical protein
MPGSLTVECADFAEGMRELVDVHYPGAERIRIVMKTVTFSVSRY